MADIGVPHSRRTPLLADLFSAHWDEICAAISRNFGAGPPDPEDAAQAAFAQFAALDAPDKIDNPRAYLHRSARNYVLDHRRRMQTQRRFVGDVSDNLCESPATDDAQRVLEGKERLAAITKTVSGLESRRRKVLIWHTIHELTFSEIARRLNISHSRVRQLFAEALAACEATTRTFDADGRPE